MQRTHMLGGASARALEIKDGNGGGDLATEVKRAVEPVMTAFESFKATNEERLAQIEKKGVADPVTEQKLKEIESTLAGYEGVNQKLVAAENQSKAAKEQADELKTQLEAVQTAMRRGAGGGDGEGKTRAEQKHRFNHFVRGLCTQWAGSEMPEEQRKAFNEVLAETKALSIANDTSGGYLAPPEFVGEIIKGVTEISAPRQLVRIRTTGSKSVMIPKRTGQFAARRVGEVEQRSETPGLAYGLVEVNAPEMYAIVDISEQNLEDSFFDLEAEIRVEAIEQFAVREGYEFVNGNTAKGEMEGILVNADIATTNSGTAASIKDATGQADGILRLKHGIKTAYAREASWVLNRTVLGSVRTLKSGQGDYIWQPGLALGKPNTIDGDVYVETPDMPNEGAGAKPIAYGDWRRGYTMVDRIAMQFLRDPFTQADSGLIRMRFRRRVGGQVVLAESMRTLTCAA